MENCGEAILRAQRLIDRVATRRMWNVSFMYMWTLIKLPEYSVGVCYLYTWFALHGLH
jgi:hypothetical protein